VIPSVNPIPLTNGLAPTPATATIRMYLDAAFRPAVLTVPPGTIITVINEAGSGGTCNLSDKEHGINSNDIGPGASVHMTAPDTPGTYNYNCSYYPETMKGTLIVATDVTTPSSAAPATATPTPTAGATTAPTTGPPGTANPPPPPASASPPPKYNPEPGTQGYLKHPEKCRSATFRHLHEGACTAYGIAPQGSTGSDDTGTGDDSGDDGPDQ
jgi:plastocyanin